jgi:hypothetical protein
MTANVNNYHIDTSIPKEIFIETINYIMPNLKELSPLTCVSKRWNLIILTHAKNQLKTLGFTLCAFLQTHQLASRQQKKLVNCIIFNNAKDDKETIHSLKEKINCILKKSLKHLFYLATNEEKTKLYNGFEFKIEHENKVETKKVSLKDQSLITCKNFLDGMSFNKEAVIINKNADEDSRHTCILNLIEDLIKNNKVNELFEILKRIKDKPKSYAKELTLELFNKFDARAVFDFIHEKIKMRSGTKQKMLFDMILTRLLKTGSIDDFISVSKKMITYPRGIHYIKQIANTCIQRDRLDTAADIAKLIPIPSKAADYLLARLDSKKIVYKVEELMHGRLRDTEAYACIREISHPKERKRALRIVFKTLLAKGRYTKALNNINELPSYDAQYSLLKKILNLLLSEKLGAPKKFRNFLSWTSEQKKALFANVNPLVLSPLIEQGVQKGEPRAFALIVLIDDATRRKELYSSLFKQITDEDRIRSTEQREISLIIHAILVPLFRGGSSDEVLEILSVLSPEDRKSWMHAIKQQCASTTNDAQRISETSEVTNRLEAQVSEQEIDEEFRNFSSWPSEKKRELFAQADPSILQLFLEQQDANAETLDLAFLITDATQRRELLSSIINKIQEGKTEEEMGDYMIDTILMPLRLNKERAYQLLDILDTLPLEVRKDYMLEMEYRLTQRT